MVKVVEMSLVTNYELSESGSDEERAESYKINDIRPDTHVKLRDPLEHLDLVSQMNPVASIEQETGLGHQDSAPTNKKKILNAIIEPQSYDSAVFELQHKAFKSQENQRIAGQSVKRKRQKTQSKKSSWEKPSDSESYTSSVYESSSDESHVHKPTRTPVVSQSAEQTPRFTSKFYGTNERDYLGRTYMHVPQDLNINLLKEPGSQECFIPKKQIYTWDGHAGGVNKLQFFPKSGHLLLSGGNDSNILLHDVYHNRRLLRGYSGHRRPLKDLDFSNTGKTFASCSFDKSVCLWDTETGQNFQNFRVKGTPNVLKFNPKNENELLVGLSNNVIEHYDLRADPASSDHIVQTYDHHLDAINSLSFISDDTKFVSTSDDKSIRIWELGINIPIKFISDPTQYSMPRSRTHPSGNYFSTQAMNNKIMVYQAHGKFKQNKKKVFEGHDVAGYGIDFTFSPDGKIVMSGGSSGKAYFWDWKTTKLMKTINVDKQIISCIEAHPQETSKVAMAGASGKIYYWE